VDLEPGVGGGRGGRPFSWIEAESADGDAAPGRPRSRLDPATPEFLIRGLKPGPYLLQVGPGDRLIKSLQYDGRDYTDRPIEIAAGQEISGVIVTVAQRGAELTGYVRDPQGRPISSNSVVLCFPADADRWSRYGTEPDRLRAATVGDDGRYQLTNLPGGDYLVVAVDDAYADALYNPAFLAKAAPLAEKVTLGWGEERSASLTLRHLP
jgi:hypothetical protein